MWAKINNSIKKIVGLSLPSSEKYLFLCEKGGFSSFSKNRVMKSTISCHIHALNN